MNKYEIHCEVHEDGKFFTTRTDEFVEEMMVHYK